MKSILNLVLLIILFINASGQEETKNDFTAQLYDIRKVSDGISRYSEPKLSPDGTKIITSRNRDTLIYIDLVKGIEVELMTTKGSFSKYNWIDTNQIYFYKRIRNEGNLIIKLGKLTLNPFKIEIDFDSRYDKSSGSINRIPFLLQGKHDVFYHARNRKVYKVENGKEIEITHESGVYFGLVVSNNAERIILRKNNGRAYNYNLNGSGEHFVASKGNVSSWSPNDDYLLYFHDTGGEGGTEYISELYICTSDGKQYQQLTNTSYLREFYPDWSSDSDKITFIDNIDYQIYVSTIVIE